MKSASFGAFLASSSALAQAQVVEWNIQHRRLDAPHSDLTRRAKATFEEIIQNGKGAMGYLAQVSVGNPPQNITLQLDTGSSDIWVPWSGATACDRDKSCDFGSCMLYSLVPLTDRILTKTQSIQSHLLVLSRSAQTFLTSPTPMVPMPRVNTFATNSHWAAQPFGT